MLLEEIHLDENKEGRQELLRGFVATESQVIIYDKHDFWIHGIISGLIDNNTYEITIADNRRAKELLYENLEKIILLKEKWSYPLPKFNV